MATVETTSGLDEVRAALVDQPGTPYFECVKSPTFPGDSGRCDVLVDSTDPRAAIAKARPLLGQLSDAADRGMLVHFRIVQGAEFLLNHANVLAYSHLRRVECGETASAAQPDTGTARVHGSRLVRC